MLLHEKVNMYLLNAISAKVIFLIIVCTNNNYKRF